MDTHALHGGDHGFIGDDKLRALLQVRPPEKPGDTPPVFSFTRKREVDIPWHDTATEKGESAGSLRAMREFFEESWWGGTGADRSIHDLNDLIYKGDDDKHLQMIGNLMPGAAESADVSTSRAPAAYRTQFKEEEVGAEPVEEGIVFRDGISGRRYLVRHLLENEKLVLDDFTTPDRYVAAWTEKIGSFELVFDSEAEAKTYYTDFEEIDLRPAFIEQRFRELDVLRELADTVDRNIPELSAEQLKEMLQGGADIAEVEQLYQRFLRLRMNKFDVERELEKLISFTAQLGYFLYREDITAKDYYKDKPEGVKDDVVVAKKGKVHSKVQRTIRWRTRESRPVVRTYRGFLGIRHRHRGKEKYWQEHSETLSVPEPVDTRSNRLAQWQDDYRQHEQHRDAEVFVFDRGPGGYLTAEGVQLRSVVERCRLDEAFRRRCVVILPIFEQSLRGTRVLTKYHIFQRPMPAIVPTILPRLSFVESLSYRTAWQGLELGELVSTVNLAPGERRTLRITKSFEQEKIVSTASTSLFELEEKASTDLTSEMESEFIDEQQKSASASLEASVSGGGAFVTAAASAKAGVETSNREFAKTINKVAKKASQSVSSRNRQEVSASTTARTTIRTTDETEATVENVNQGRTLNLMFYRLYNRYEGGLYLDGLQFEIIPSCELIEGSGVYDSLRYGFGDFERVVQELRTTPLPFEANTQQLADLIVRNIESLVGKEYAKQDSAQGGFMAATSSDEGHDGPPASPRSIGVMRFKPRGALLAGAPGSEVTDGVTDEVTDEVTDLTERLREAIATLDSGERVEPIDLVVATPGLYLDALVGQQPSTEPYSELMREQEVRMRRAEAFAKESEGIYQRAQATRLAALGDNGAN